MLYNIIRGVLRQSEDEGGKGDDIDEGLAVPTGFNTDEWPTNTVSEDSVADVEPKVNLKSASGSLEEVVADHGRFVYSSAHKDIGPDAKQKRNE
ncbi:hypothetical protein PGT21_009552 [Puccinia graminis f. sp. tritici]|uniref:Uncharacterized protein n=1 Tax=Puccinia graminis f. sp. tritici TaxID=56615 RepID=A0A5B0Q9V7_PUCGR|nr:hypothetical protein PGT21_009552 [Puccinia graminis f. sp. tritici]